jgi:hypothetical protein
MTEPAPPVGSHIADKKDEPSQKASDIAREALREAAKRLQLSIHIKERTALREWNAAAAGGRPNP